LQARGIDAEHLRSVVLINDDGTFQKSEAAIRILRELPGWGWFGVFRLVPTALRNIVYGTIAASRYRLMGKKETCRIPTLEERGRFLE
jgi:predicted DCC family thiol-disulfide oxidoreductase YuxK